MQRFKTLCVLVVMGGYGCEYPGTGDDEARLWVIDSDVTIDPWPGTSSSTGHEDEEIPDLPEDVCELPTCEGPGDCVPRNLYGEIAAGEYFNECRNYCHADDHCFDRATAMLGSLVGACDLDLRGPDGEWCDELDPPDTTGGCDDLVYKVVIRYPAGESWTYHIATLVKTCEDGLCVIDPLAPPDGAPTTQCMSAAEWCEAHAHGDDIEWGDTDDLPPAGTVYCEIVPGDQQYWDDDSVADPTDTDVVDNVCKTLSDHVAKLCAEGHKPFPPGCGMDADGDGIPDDYDKCPNSPPGSDVDYCDPMRLGCADGEGPGAGGGGTTTTGGAPIPPPW